MFDLPGKCEFGVLLLVRWLCPTRVWFRLRFRLGIRVWSGDCVNDGSSNKKNIIINNNNNDDEDNDDNNEGPSCS